MRSKSWTCAQPAIASSAVLSLVSVAAGFILGACATPPESLHVAVTNPGTAPLRDHQVNLVLHAAREVDATLLPRLRVHQQSDGRWLPHWVQFVDPRSNKASIWVKLPEVAAGDTVVLTLRYAPVDSEDLSSGRRVFEMFDDFGEPGLGYFRFGTPTTVMTRSLSWESEAPHTLSVVELNRGGYRFWGYYGLADCGGIGIARSNDLTTWEKLPKPLFTGDGERWPSALKVGGTIYMAHDRDYCGTSHIVLRTSRDGLNFEAAYRTLVTPEPGLRNQNPALFQDPADGRFYLFWFRGGSEAGFWQIRARSAATVEGLADPANEHVLLDVPYELAAPNMMAYDGTYFLSTEVNENAWKTRIYAGPTPLGPFKLLPDAPQLSDNQACLFQHIFDGVMHGYLCKVIGTTWVLNHRIADLRAGRMTQRALDEGVWTPISGAWQVHTDEAKGVTRLVASAPGLLRTALTGREAHVEALGRAVVGGWGIALNVQDADTYVAALVVTRAVHLVQHQQGVETVLSTVEGQTNAETWQELGVRLLGDEVTAFINQRPVVQARLAAPSASGHAALISLGRAEFDDVRWRKASLLAPQVVVRAPAPAGAVEAMWAAALVSLIASAVIMLAWLRHVRR
ncbi:MAG: DUF2341 domain-containing protein [Anaerolineae bacterium]|nr:DUF2341 domain-containing protein [Anaerolineae bacterium]